MYAFDDTAAVLSVLERMSARAEPLTQLLERQPGAREARWVHLLCGPVAETPAAAHPPALAGAFPADGLAQRVTALEQHLQAMEERLRATEERLLGLESVIAKPEP